jgi:hypothetical protein
MQKDIHYSLTYALACKVGIDKDAEIIAWADQFTDELTKADLYGLQTQSDIIGNWKDPQVQATVLVPFHFLPGEVLWAVTAHSTRSQMLINAALIDPIRLGIALHTLQDTFSHQGFTGWNEKFNACFAFDNIWSVAIPNVGHADMRTMPDMVNIEWTDPRTGEKIDNKIRAYRAAKDTFDCLVKFYGKDPKTQWVDFEFQLRQIFSRNTKNTSVDYDWRKKELQKFANASRYNEIKELMKDQYKSQFIAAAQKHLAIVMDSF